jgi:hypothetical protein
MGSLSSGWLSWGAGDATTGTPAQLGLHAVFYSMMIAVICRQAIRRKVRRTRWYLPALLAFLLAAIGYFCYSLDQHPIRGAQALLLVVSFGVLGIGMGIIRARTIKFWHDGSTLCRKGTPWTVILWLIAVSLHTAVDHVAHVGSASLLLYLAVTFLTQASVVRARVRAITASYNSRSGFGDELPIGGCAPEP